MSNPIVTENANTGSSGWQMTKPSTTLIQGYTDQTSYAPLDTITFLVSTVTAGTSYSITIYRLGWYAGLGGRLMTTLSGLVGQAQGYYNVDTQTLSNCSTCFSDSTTHLLEARWAASTTLVVPAGWVTGTYLAIFTDANGWQSATHFTVKGNTSAPYMLQRPDNTDAAYNPWGGNSLYTFNSISNVAATKVSFDRPSCNNFGLDYVLSYEVQLIHWLESQGYNLSYIGDVDTHTNAAQLLGYQACISYGHNEYWSKAMRDGWEAARNAGIGLAFLAANACYWQVRYEASGLGAANKTIVGYKCATINGLSDLQRDPQYGINNAVVTSQWRDAVVNRPENAMIGIMFSSSTTNGNVAWTVDANSPSSYLNGTGLTKGSSYGVDLVGYEWDRIWANGSSPLTLQIIATTATVPQVGGADTSHSTHYLHPSGALVFASGSVGWIGALSTYRYPGGWNTQSVVSGMQTLLANVLTNLIVTHKTFSMLQL